MTDSQVMARRFNEDEAVQQSYEYRRRLRLLLGDKSQTPDDVLDEVDWIEAERECRESRCVGTIVMGRSLVS
ncbi:MAG: hypothetical protein ABJB61_02335 [bacterium]